MWGGGGVERKPEPCSLLCVPEELADEQLPVEPGFDSATGNQAQWGGGKTGPLAG